MSSLFASGCAEGYARDATEIQNIQIAEGDVCHGLSIPIYMVFPRLFTCPTLETTNFWSLRPALGPLRPQSWGPITETVPSVQSLRPALGCGFPPHGLTSGRDETVSP
uniref:Uncharacterized protein n=1 Tax=Knipowitschia caucasica TaxID=637954 RepID=A0AAV2J4A5_KNICA